MLPTREKMDKDMKCFQISVSQSCCDKSGCLTEEHWHPYPELQYVLRGETTITAGDERFPFLEGDMVLLPSGMVHGTYCDTEGCSIAVALFSWDGELSGYYLSRSRQEEAGITPLVDNIQREARLQKPGWKNVVRGLLYEVVGLLQRYGDPLYSLKPSTSKGVELEEYIRQNLNRELSLEAVACHEGYSPSYFSRHFAELMGMPFKRYVDEMRVKAARSILDHGGSVGQAASTLGYPTPSTFSRTFKRITGQSPTEYLAEQQKVDRIG